MKRIIWITFAFLTLLPLGAQNREQLYQLGKRSFQDQLYTQAIEKFRSFMDFYSQDPRVDSALYMTGVSWYYLRSWNSSLSALTELEEKYPDSTYLNRSSYWKGLSYYNTENFGKADQAFQSQLFHRDESYYYDRSLLYLGLIGEKKEEWSRAEKWYLQLEEESENNSLLVQGIFRAGLVRMRQERFEEALQLFQHLMLDFSSSPFSRDLPYYSGLCYTGLQNYSEANRRFRSYLQLNPQGDLSQSVRFQLAENLQKLGDLQEAEIILEVVAEQTSGGDLHSRALLSLASLSLEQENWDKAETRLTEVYQRLEGHYRWEAAYNLAVLYRKSGVSGKALPLLEELRQVNEGDLAPKSLLMMAHILREQGSLSEALVIYREYWEDFEEEPGRSEAGRWMVSLYQQLERLQEADDILDSLLEEYPHDRDRASFLFMKGEIAQEIDDSSAALQWYSRVIKEFPKAKESSNALYQTGYIYAERGEHIRASEYFLKLIESAPDEKLTRDARFALALAYYNGEDPDRGIKELKSYIVSYPGDVRNGDAGYFLGDLLFQETDYTQAYEYFDFSAEASTGAKKIKSLYMKALCQYRQGNWTEGREEFLHLSTLDPVNSWSKEGLYMAGVGSRNEELYTQAESDLLSAADGSSGELKERSLYLLTQVYLDQNKKDEALIQLNQLRAEFPEGELAVNLLYRQGDLAFSQENYSEALEWYQLCLRQYPEHELSEQALLRAALSFLELMDYQSSQDLLLSYLGSGSSPSFEAQAARTLSDSIRQQNKAAEAEELFRRVEELHPAESTRASLFLAVQRVGGFSGESQDYLKEIYDKESLSPLIRNEALILMAHNLKEKGEGDDAAELYRVLISTDSGTLGAEAQFSLAGILAEQNPLVGAEEYMNLFYLYPKESDWASEGLFRAWEIYRQDNNQQRKADIIAEKLRTEFPISPWIEKLED